MPSSINSNKYAMFNPNISLENEYLPQGCEY